MILQLEIRNPIKHYSHINVFLISIPITLDKQFGVCMSLVLMQNVEPSKNRIQHNNNIPGMKCQQK